MQEFRSEEQKIRPAAVAGAFYPENPSRLRGMVEELLKHANVSLDRPPKALIAPHAGYIYSGPIAASAFSVLPRDTKRVVVVGPSHHFNFAGLAVSKAAAFQTPLGQVPIDTEALQRIAARPQVQPIPQAHRFEHSVEVMLPFLQVILKEFTLVPIVSGSTSDEEMGGLLEQLWEGPETRFIISSDLSHYHNYDDARQLDLKTAQSIEQLRAHDIHADSACGRVPIRGLIWCAQRHQLRVRTLDLRNSGDTAGPRDRVVGYGAFAFV
jgi:AmmeMemoRadiSam system protein B